MTNRKQILAAGLLLLGATAAPAQTFDRLWKDVDAAMAKDQPRTALAAVGQIRDKAAVANDEGQLLSATLAALWLDDAVSPDSTAINISRMEAAAARTTSPVAKALWQCAIAKALDSMPADTADASRARALFRQSLADSAALAAARATAYVPPFIIGRDSRHYNNDVLSVVSQTALAASALSPDERRQIAARLIAHYRQSGNRPAALLATLDSLSLLGDSRAVMNGDAVARSHRQALLRLAREYADLPVNVETYIALTQTASGTGLDAQQTDSLLLAEAREGLRRYKAEKRAASLRNFIAGKERAAYTLFLSRQTLYPGDTLRAQLTGHNLRRLTLTAYRLIGADAASAGDADGAFKRFKREKAATATASFAATPAHVVQKDSLSLRLTSPGVYVCEVRADGLPAKRHIVYVSRLTPLVLIGEDGQARVRLLDTRTGAPLDGGRVKACRDDAKGDLRQVAVYTAGAGGEIVIPALGKRETDGWRRYFPTVGTDAYSPSFTCYNYPVDRRGENLPVTTVQLYTDRGIYRPGQALRFGGIAMTQQGDDTKAVAGLELRVKLLDANGQTVGERTCRTDSFGTVSGTFDLPDPCLPGTFTLQGDRGGQTAVRVESYKRPTFTVEAAQPRTGYRLGDTVSVSGTAKAYTGVPIVGARVDYTVTPSYFYRRYADGDALRPQSGTATTDSAGRFSLPIALNRVETSGFYGLRYTVDIAVVASNGETATGSVTLNAGNRRGRLSADWPATVCREDPRPVSATLTGPDGQTLPATVNWRISRTGRSVDVVAADTLSSGRAALIRALDILPSGEYTVQLTAQDADTLTRRFLVLSTADKRPAGHAAFWQYVRTSAAADSALVIIGSPADSVTLFYDLYSGDRRIESRTVTFSDSLLHFPINYRPEFGDGARATFAFVRDGQVYSLEATVERPRPDKRLTLSWSTFRSRLVPGQEETWTLRVTYPDGRPADALVMARLYDAALDAFAPAPWDFDIGFYRRLPLLRRAGDRTEEASWSDAANVAYAHVPQLSFTRWDERLFGHRYYGFARNSWTLMNTQNEMALDVAAPRMALMSSKAVRLKGAGASAGGGTAEPAVTPRANFAETAFFRPDLRTDASGAVSIAFTLPQSLTTWNFTALAHTRGMDYGQLDTTAVARKDFMVQPALPRFVRRGDRVSIPVSLKSLTPEALRGKARLVLTDATTGAVVQRQQCDFSLSAGGQATARFDFTATTTAPVLVCRVTATAGSFSDGEEQYLPVLADRVEVTRAIPFALHKSGTRTLGIDTLFAGGNLAADRRLTVEVSSNPTWYAVTALPGLAQASGESAVDFATRYYAATLAASIARYNPGIDSLFHADATGWANILSRNPELKQTLLSETPWVAAAKTETERTAALHRLFDAPAIAATRTSAADRLKALQDADGAYAWYPGMKGNAYITADVALLLARLEALCGDRDASGQLDRALAYLDRKMAEDVARMKRDKTRLVGTTHLRYLYIRALRGTKPDATARYLLDACRAETRDMSIADKALLAVVLTRGGERQAAAETMKSLEEYTVATADMGRYFDTRRAALTRESYRIPTQTAAIEALRLSAGKAAADMADEMCLWLMQARRTQLWTGTRTTADAVYALLLAAPTSSRVMALDATAAPVRYRLARGSETVASSDAGQVEGRHSVGYYSQTYTDAKTLGAKTLTLSKDGDGLSWGSVVAQYTLPQSAVVASASGISVTTRWEIRRGTVWQALAANAPVSVGDRLRRVVTLTADRDCDFVAVKVARPACLAPLSPLSDYASAGSTWAYRAVHDTSSDLFIEHLPKGRATLTEEYAADRAGRYAAGTVSAQCLYAPEFGGQTAGSTVTVE